MNNHEHSHFELNKILHDKMNKIYFYQALSTFAKSLIGIFVPVYLFKLNYAIVEILAYVIAISFIYLIMIPISVKIIKEIGFKYTLLFSTPIYLLHIIALNFADSIIYFHISWITFGFYVSIFWPAFHSEIALNGSKKHRSSQMGTLQILTAIIATAAPLVTGIVLTTSSYFYLLVIVSILIFIGIIPLLLAKDIKLKNYDFNYIDYIRMIKSKKNINAKTAFFFEGIEKNLLMIIIWPIFVFIFLDSNYLSFGFLLSFIAFLNIIFILYTKSYFDKQNKNFLLKRTTQMMSISWLLKSFILFFGIFFLFIIESISKIIRNTFDILFNSIFYNNAKEKGYMDYIILRELYMHCAKIIFAILLIIILLVFGENMKTLGVIIFVGVFASLGLSYLRTEN